MSEQRIRFGMGAIKGLGDGALEAILSARQTGEAFTSLYDFCERVSLKHLNKKTLEALVRSGAFDCFSRPRSQLNEALDRAIDAARGTQRDLAMGQVSLFAAPELARAVKPREVFQDGLAEWTEAERLKLEKEAIGFYVSGHPLDRYARDLQRLTNATIISLENKGNNAQVVLGVSVSAIRERPLKDGSGRMAFVVVEDLTGAIEMMVSARAFGEFGELLKSDQPLLVKAAVSVDRSDPETSSLRVRCLEVKALADVRAEGTQFVEILLEESQVERANLARLKTILRDFPGRCRVGVRVRIPGTAEVELALPDELRLNACDAMVDRVETLFGRGVIRLG